MRLDSAAGWRMCSSNVSQRDTPGWRIARVQAAAAGIAPAHCAVHINILIINYGLQQPKALHIFPRAFVCLLHCVADCAPLVGLMCKHGRRMSTQIPLAQPVPKAGVWNSRLLFSSLLLLLWCIHNRKVSKLKGKPSNVHTIQETYPW